MTLQPKDGLNQGHLILAWVAGSLVCRRLFRFSLVNALLEERESDPATQGGIEAGASDFSMGYVYRVTCVPTFVSLCSSNALLEERESDPAT